MINFTYDNTELSFKNVKARNIWCEKHSDLYNGHNVGNRGSTPARNIFDQISNAKRDDEQSALNKHRHVKPPILDTSSGRYFEYLKSVDTEAFKFALEHWHEFGIGSIGQNRGVNSHDLIGITLALNARFASPSLDVLTLKNAITRSTDAIASLEHVENRFKGYMEAGAGVDYWKGKETEHTTKRSERLKHIMYLIAAFTFVLLAFPTLFYSCLLTPWTATVKAAGLAPDYVMFSFVGIFALIISMGVWGVRVLVKLYLSEHHLLIDASERVTMIQTYLALTDEGKMDNNDRHALLATIFRPTQDGVVKDEGFDPSITGLLGALSSRG